MNLPYSRAPHTSGTPATQPEAPNAALLIDFDNVTMGMRSDLSKELKTLLNSDIIKGKVTVQRAYADWRRYPQYIVPLSENSVDLIFAPAYGSSKKNATDIRMAIDGMELVFIRPEIGTYILLTGDSDFSSLVLKLKEYGKYVIGVGIQESSSDILVQNCDEYYSYTSLSGLRKTTDSANKPLDPWVLVEEAVKKMAARNDVMRSDRLKQVMMEIDASFDEGNFGFSKFSKFLSEAASRNLVTLRKMENGQYEVHPPGSRESEAGRGRGGPARRSEARDRGRGEKGPRERASAVEPKPEEAPVPDEAAPEPGDEMEPATQEKEEGDPLRAAYGLLLQAYDKITDGKKEGPVRDSDLKRKMLEMDPSFDEGELGFSKFSRFLRQAHDHEIIDLQKRDEGTYQVSLPGRTPEAATEAAPRAHAGSMPGPQPGKEAPRSEPEEKVDSARHGGRTEGWGLGVRRGERAQKKEKEGPPPILEGQVIQPGASGSSEEGKGGGGEVAMDLFAEPSEQPDVDVGELGLPSGRAAVIRYLSNSYKGVGNKTAENLVDAFGGDLFKILQTDPKKISSVVSGKRAEQLLEAWNADYQRRRERALRSAGGGSKGKNNHASSGAGGNASTGGESGEAPQQKERTTGEKDEEEPGGQGGDSSSRKSPPKRRTRRGGRSRRQ